MTRLISEMQYRLRAIHDDAGDNLAVLFHVELAQNGLRKLEAEYVAGQQRIAAKYREAA